MSGRQLRIVLSAVGLCALFGGTALASTEAAKQACELTSNCSAADNCTIVDNADATAWACVAYKENRYTCFEALELTPGGRRLDRAEIRAVRDYYEKQDEGGKKCEPPSFSTSAWCADALTGCWTTRRPYVSGIRLTIEPAFSGIFSFGDNRIKQDALRTVPGIGVETNLYASWIGFQVQVMLPFRAEFDDQSEARTQLTNEEGEVDVDLGLACGLTVFDGAIAAGVGWLNFDDRDFMDSADDDMTTQVFFYLNLQPASALRAVAKRF